MARNRGEVKMDGQIEPWTWKGIIAAGVQALVEVARALHRIADGLADDEEAK